MKKTDEEIRKEFNRIIESRKITDDSSEEEIKKFINEVSNWLLENIPKKLYRYRTYTDYNIRSLENEEIWGSSLLNLNDSFEGIPSFNLEQINQDLKEAFSVEGLVKYIQIILQYGYPKRYEKMLPERVKENFSKNLENNLKNNLKNIEENSTEMYNILLKQKDSFVYNLNNKMYEIISNILKEYNVYRGFKKIACFSTDYKSTTMWGHYADGGNGFVIEYDMTEVIKKCNMNCNVETIKKCGTFGLNYLLAPVIYREKNYDGTDLLIQTIMYNILNDIFSSNETESEVKYFDYDTLFSLKLILNKSDVWNNEKEWRLIANLNSKTELCKPECILKCKPKKVYLGINMKEEHRNKIIAICKEKNIEYDEMQVNFFSADYSLESRTYFKENSKPLISI